MSFSYEDWKNELAIDAFVIVHNHLYLMEKSIRREIKQQMELEMEPERVALNSFQRGTCDELLRQRCALRLVCQRILSYGRQTVEKGYPDWKIRMEIAARACFRQVKAQELELELVEDMDARRLDDLHREKLEALMVYDPKRKCRVPSRFCSIHLASFDLDDKSTVGLGPRYERDLFPSGTRLTKYVAANKHYELADYSTEVISIRVVKAGPDYTYPVEVYGKVIARDEIDHKCVYLFDRERKDAQTIKSKKDMLALTGPYRGLVPLGFMYFEFDLKIKCKDDPDDEVEFSKGVMSYFCNPNRKRIIMQLPSFQSTVKLVLQHVKLPVAASLEVSVVNKEPNAPLVHFHGKITAGTTRNYRDHMVLYDSSVSSGNLVGENGSLVLNRKLVCVNGSALGCAFEKDELLVLYVCFLDASCEIEDKDKMQPEEEDYEEKEVEEKEEDEEEEEDPKNVVTLKYPLSETVWEHGCPKLKVKVDWTAVLDRPEGAECYLIYSSVPDGCAIDYRYGICYE